MAAIGAANWFTLQLGNMQISGALFDFPFCKIVPYEMIMSLQDLFLISYSKRLLILEMYVVAEKLKGEYVVRPRNQCYMCMWSGRPTGDLELQSKYFQMYIRYNMLIAECLRRTLLFIPARQQAFEST